MLKELTPAGLFYLNDSTGEPGGPGALEEIGERKGRGVGRAENLMYYIGHEDTYTPSHREICASLGQDIAVNTLVAQSATTANPNILAVRSGL